MLRPGSPYWAERTGPTRRHTYPSFKGDTTADVVVIGGGLTGCATASVLAAAGMDVILLEAARLAGGATARGLGAIVPQPDARFRSVEEISGVRAARTAWQETARSAREFAAALKKLPLKVDLSPAPFLVNTEHAEVVAGLRKEQAARKAAGLDAPWLSAAAAKAELGTDTTGALRLKDAWTFDPVRAALGFGAAADAKGARVFEKSEVRRTRFTRTFADVFLASGRIRTQGVVVATGEPGALFSQLRRHVHTLEGHVVVTEPLSAVMRRETGRRAAVMTEAGPVPHWLRWLPDDRAMFAGALAPPSKPRERERVVVQRTAQLMYELSVRYPVISGLPAQWGWSVPVVSTPDGLPWIGPHRNYPFHFFALAFGWHGDGLAWLAARAALRHYAGGARREDEVLGFARHL